MSTIPRLTAISAGDSRPGPDFTRWLEGVRAAPVDAVQIREKAADGVALLAMVEEALAVLDGRARVLVNGRADVALATGAAGVHLPASGIPESAVRRLLGSGALVGRSTHSAREVDRARLAGADYVYYSPIFPTPGKGAAVGLEALAEVAARGIPVIALGGITIDRLPAVAAAGAVGVAGIGMFQEIGDPDRLAEVAVHSFRDR